MGDARGSRGASKRCPPGSVVGRYHHYRYRATIRSRWLPRRSGLFALRWRAKASRPAATGASEQGRAQACSVGAPSLSGDGTLRRADLPSAGRNRSVPIVLVHPSPPPTSAPTAAPVELRARPVDHGKISRFTPPLERSRPARLARLCSRPAHGKCGGKRRFQAGIGRVRLRTHGVKCLAEEAARRRVRAVSRISPLAVPSERDGSISSSVTMYALSATFSAKAMIITSRRSRPCLARRAGAYAGRLRGRP